VATDSTGEARYGLVTYGETIGTLARTDEDAASMAQWVLPRVAVTRTLVSEVRAPPLGFSQWPELLGLRLLDRIRVQRDYGPATPIDTQLLVKRLGLRVTRDPKSFELTIGTDAPPAGQSANALKLGTGPGLGTGRLDF
jgi:hypothetical protein